MGKNKNGAYYGQIGKLTAQNGYVVYQRITEDSSKNNIWGKVHAGFNDVLTSNQQEIAKLTWANVANVLRMTGAAEQKKELKMLKEVFGSVISEEITWEEYPKYINTINLLLGMKDKYGLYLQELQAQAKDKTNQRAAGGFRYFESRLATTIRQNVIKAFNGFSTSQLLTLTADEITEKISSILQTAIEDAIYKVADEGAGYIGKEVKLWEQIRDGFNNLNAANKDNFLNEIMKRYKLESVASKIGTWLYDNFRNPRRKKDLFYGMNVEQKLDINEIKGASLDGFLSEFLPSLFMPKSKGTGVVFGGNVMKTDSVRFLYGEITAEIPNSLLEEAVNLTSKDLAESEQQINRFTNEILAKTENIFIVYDSSKMYRLSGSFDKRGFHGTSGNLSNLGSSLAQYGVTPNNLTLNIANILYQTIPGAILESQQSDIISQTKKIIIQNIMSAMFDDTEFQGINSGDDRVIHMLVLDNVQIPLSYYCLGLAEAIETYLIQDSLSIMNDFVQVSIKLPEKILYPEPVNSPGYEILDSNGDKMSFPDSVFTAWNLQAQDAREKSKFEISILRNFNDIIQQLTQYLV